MGPEPADRGVRGGWQAAQLQPIIGRVLTLGDSATSGFLLTACRAKTVAESKATNPGTERAVLIQAYDATRREQSVASLHELHNLVLAAGAEVAGELTQARTGRRGRRRIPASGSYLGRGKMSELNGFVKRVEADLVVCDDDLTPAQARSLEAALGGPDGEEAPRVIDRSELIMDIFARRARTRQARLQVELAQLEYSLPRLKRLWTHLDRVAGGNVGGKAGIGVRGPGERQLEVDRRLAQKRISELKGGLAKIEGRSHREALHRGGRFTTVALVGYTNAGKSTLMNALTGAGVPVGDRLFETLDTRTRECTLSEEAGARATVMLSDTVGFIRKLPHHLVASFHATLEEAREADLLLHVADASSAVAQTQIQAANDMLGEIGCAGRPMLLVLNKLDAVTSRPDAALRLPMLRGLAEHSVAISAATGEGMGDLRGEVARLLERAQVELTIEADIENGKLVAMLYESGAVLERTYEGNKVRLRVRVPLALRRVIEAMGGRELTALSSSPP